MDYTEYIFVFILPVGAYIKYLWVKDIPEMGDKNGYRTKMSLKNEDTWEFANKYNAIVYRNLAIITFLMGIAFIWFSPQIEKYIKIYKSYHWLMILQQIVLIFAIFFVDIKLRMVFDKDGNRREV